LLTQIHHICSGAEAKYDVADDTERQSDGDHERVEAEPSESVHEHGPAKDILKIYNITQITSSKTKLTHIIISTNARMAPWTR
jgi:hypothetical protein